MGNIYGKFADQNSEVLTGIIQTSNNNQSTLNAAIADSDHLRATPATFQAGGLLITPDNKVPTVTAAVQGTVGAALGGIGQTGTPSEEPGGGGNPCPELTQFTWVVSDMGTRIPTQVQYLSVGMMLWNPVSYKFERIRKADVVNDQDLWGLQLYPTVYAIGSAGHPLIKGVRDKVGTPLSEWVGGKYLLFSYGRCQQMPNKRNPVKAVNLERKGSVMHIETEGPGHIYAAGSTIDMMAVWHNLKPLNEPGERPI